MGRLGPTHLGPDRAHQARIARQPQDIVDGVVLAPAHDGFAAKARVASDADARVGPVTAKLPHDAFELLEAAGRGIAVRGAKPCTQQVLATEDIQRQITVVPVIPVEESPFLVTVHRVIGRVEVEPDLARRPAIRLHEQLHQQFIKCLGARDDALVATARRLLGLTKLQAVQGARAGQGMAPVALAHAPLAGHVRLADQHRNQRIIA